MEVDIMYDSRLKTLLTLVKVKNYTKTAQRLYITQPAVTNHIKSLEHEYDIVIFSNQKTFELTEQGEILIEYATRMLNQSIQLEEAIKGSLLASKKINFAVTDKCSIIMGKNGLLDILLEGFNSGGNFYVKNLEEIFDGLQTGKYDFAIVDSNYNDDLFDGVLLDTFNIVPVCYTEGKFKEIKRVTREMLKNNPIILGDQEEGMNISAKKSLKDSNINLAHNVFYYSNSAHVMGELIKNKDGIGFMYHQFCNNISNVKKMDLLNFKCSQGVYFIYNNSSHNKKIINPIVKRLKKWIS